MSFLAIVVTVIATVGCRKPLSPNVDSNQAPETWIVGAPQDTITEFDPDDGTPVRPQLPDIASRFHVYWAGSDRDGDIAGFYFAVVETLPQAPAGSLPGTPLPPLPGPKPRDYRFTTRTDSFFVFNVSEVALNRQHAFYIYAVDDKGRADPTPARIVFNAVDRFPPEPVFTTATASGLVYRWVGDSNGHVEESQVVVPITDTYESGEPGAPRDTVPASARLDFAWSATVQLAGSYVTGYKYKLDEPVFSALTPRTSVSYNTGPADYVPPGPKLFTLWAFDEASGKKEANRRFYMNHAPDTWYSGPDPAQYPFRDPETGLPYAGSPPPFAERFNEVSGGTGWENLQAQPGSLLSCDSLWLRPASRPERRTFFEIYKNRLYVHQEGDTVRLNSWVLLHAGGTDKDSPYSVVVAENDPILAADTSGIGVCGGQPAIVVHETGPNASPIGFRAQYTTFLDPNGPASTPSRSGLLPIYDTGSSLWKPAIGSYRANVNSGKVYAVLRAEDGHRLVDERIRTANVRRIADNPATPAEVALRSKILVFYVNKAPRLDIANPQFVPQLPWPRTFPTRQLSLNLAGKDEDPYDPLNRPPVGGPSPAAILRWTVKVKGKDASGNDIVFTPPGMPVFQQQVTIVLPAEMAGGNATLLIQLCDCETCEVSPGQGRCVDYEIPIIIPPPTGSDAPPTEVEQQTRPGDSNESNRSSKP